MSGDQFANMYFKNVQQHSESGSSTNEVSVKDPRRASYVRRATVCAMSTPIDALVGRPSFVGAGGFRTLGRTESTVVAGIY